MPVLAHITGLMLYSAIQRKAMKKDSLKDLLAGRDEIYLYPFHTWVP